MLHFQEFYSIHHENELVTVLSTATSGAKSSAQLVSITLHPRPQHAH